MTAAAALSHNRGAVVHHRPARHDLDQGRLEPRQTLHSLRHRVQRFLQHDALCGMFKRQLGQPARVASASGRLAGKAPAVTDQTLAPQILHSRFARPGEIADRLMRRVRNPGRG
jgi:hypothetical protein